MSTEFEHFVLDDDGLRRLLKFPADADLRYYRDRADLPYVAFKQDGKTDFRYVTSEVLKWMMRRQHHKQPDGAVDSISGAGL